VDCNVGEIGWIRGRPARRGSLPRFGPNECLYQFVSIVFEYFCAFVTILIPRGRGSLDRCSPFYICVAVFIFNTGPFDRAPGRLRVD
jgi:hypothetical protein